MSESIKRKRDTLINFAYIALVLALVYLFFKYCFGVTAPFLLSFLLAVALQKPLRWLDKKTKNKCHTFWSIFLVFLCVIIIAGPVVLILTLVGKEIASFVSFLIGQLSDLPAFMITLENELLKFLEFLPDGIYSSVSESITRTFSDFVNGFDISLIGIDAKSITNGLTSGITGVYSVVKNVPSVLIAIVIGIVAWIFFTKDYRRIVKFITLQLPDNKKNLLSETKQVFTQTILKMFRAYGIIMFITFCELFVGLNILRLIGFTKNNYLVIIAVAIAIFDILPVAGSGGILIPWAIVSAVMGNFGMAAGLMVIYAVISVIRQYIEPKIVGTSLGVHPIVTLAGLYFGLKLFGFLGMFIVPICVMTLKAFNDAGRIHLYKPVQRN